jgi:hypothetical protein
VVEETMNRIPVHLAQARGSEQETRQWAPDAS